jgi:hypothetical protein
MHIQNTRHIAKIFCAVIFTALVASTSPAAIVWDLNPNDLNAPAGSNTQVFTSGGFSITARGFDNNNGIGTPRELYYKNKPPVDGAVEFGLGLVTPHNEINAGPNGPLNFIQFDVTAILAAGMFNGQISVGSLQAGESFSIHGSNTLGTLGTQLSGPFPGLTFDNQFVALPDFGLYNFYSIVASSGNVLPVALSAEVAPIPEMYALLPIAGLVLLVFATKAWRKRTPRTV